MIAADDRDKIMRDYMRGYNSLLHHLNYTTGYLLWCNKI
jgi:hypothetical protein